MYYIVFASLCTYSVHATVAGQLNIIAPLKVDNEQVNTAYMKTQMEYNTKDPSAMSALLEKMKRVMHYKPTLEELEHWKPYRHSDSGDVKTVSRFDSYQLNVPSFGVTYDGQAINEKGTVKEKRFVMNTIKPVYEIIENDSTQGPQVPYLAPKRSQIQPSWVQKEPQGSGDDFYFHNIFTDKDAPPEIDTARSEVRVFPVIKDGALPDEPETETENVVKDLSNGFNRHHDNANEYSHHNLNNINDHHHNINEHSRYDRGHELADREKAIEEQAGNRYEGARQLKDVYRNRYGELDLKKLSHHSARKLRDNEERMKGFHKIHHKDEYQVEKQFHNNVANVEHDEDVDNSRHHQKGEMGLSQKDLAAIVGEEASSYYKGRNRNSNVFDNYRNKANSRYPRQDDNYDLLPMGFYNIPD